VLEFPAKWSGAVHARSLDEEGSPMLKRTAVLALVLVAVVATFLFVVRPWYLRWGATEEEFGRALPGDSILGEAAVQETRALTINAPVERVWPWIAQIGQDRGGFYSFDLLENLVGCEMPTDDRLRPEKQSWALNDKFWMYPPHKAGGIGFATLRVYERGRVLGFGTRAMGTPLYAPENGSWTFVLESLDGSNTRLLIRGRGAPGRSLGGTIFDRMIFEPAHFAMERRMMIGLKQLVEHGSRSRLVNHAHVVLWAVTFGIFLWSAALVVAGVRWGHSLSLFVAAAGLFQFLTLRQPHIVIGATATLVLAVIAIAPNVGRRERTPTSRHVLRGRLGPAFGLSIAVGLLAATAAAAGLLAARTV
jgi:hypothetical protein